MEILNDLEKAKIATFVDDKVMLEAVRKVLLAGLFNNGTMKPGENFEPTKNFALSLVYQAQGTLDDATIGAQLRADAEAIRIVENGFKKLAELAVKPAPEKAKKPNPGI